MSDKKVTPPAPLQPKPVSPPTQPAYNYGEKTLSDVTTFFSPPPPPPPPKADK